MYSVKTVSLHFENHVGPRQGDLVILGRGVNSQYQLCSAVIKARTQGRYTFGQRFCRFIHVGTKQGSLGIDNKCPDKHSKQCTASTCELQGGRAWEIRYFQDHLLQPEIWQERHPCFP